MMEEYMYRRLWDYWALLGLAVIVAAVLLMVGS